jgi:glycosyltransferase involved in cell wall biosynthesis
MQTPLVSCVIPVWNGEKYLAEAIESVLNQTYPKIELVIVDDGSTDGTPDVIAFFKDRVTSIRQEQSGPAAARNTGISASKGAFVAFIDSDDIWEASKTALQVDLLTSREDVSVCLCEVQNFWSPEITVPEGADLPNGADPVSGWFAQSMVIRRNAFETVGLFDPTLRHREAMEWLRRVSDAGLKVDIVKKVLVRRRLHLTNRSRSRAEEDRKALLKIAQEAMLRRRIKQP